MFKYLKQCFENRIPKRLSEKSVALRTRSLHVEQCEERVLLTVSPVMDGFETVAENAAVQTPQTDWLEIDAAALAANASGENGGLQQPLSAKTVLTEGTYPYGTITVTVATGNTLTLASGSVDNNITIISGAASITSTGTTGKVQFNDSALTSTTGIKATYNGSNSIVVTDLTETTTQTSVDISGFNGSLVVNGTAGNDLINLSDLVLTTTVNAGAGDDVINAHGTNNKTTVNAGNGNDTIIGTSNYTVGSTGENTLVVDLATDSGDTNGLELRTAVSKANADAKIKTINFTSDISTVTLEASKNQLELTKAMTIDGSVQWNGVTSVARSGKITIKATHVDGSNTGRIINNTASGTSLQSLILTGGHVTGTTSPYGAGLRNTSVINLTDVEITGNTSVYAAGIANTGAGTINMYGTVTVSGNTMTGSADKGAGINNDGIINLYGSLSVTINTANGQAQGVGIHNTKTFTTVPASETEPWSGTLTVTGNVGSASTVSGGGIANTGSFSVSGGTVNISNNTAGGNGGGIYNTKTMTLTANSLTINGNSATNGGGIYNTSTFSVSGDAEPLSNTVAISNNTASGAGGGIYNTSTVNLNVNVLTISGNQSVGSGAGIYTTGSIISTGATATISDNKITGASGTGAAIYQYGTNLIKTQLTAGTTTFSGNTVAALANVDGLDIQVGVLELGYDINIYNELEISTDALLRLLSTADLTVTSGHFTVGGDGALTINDPAMTATTGVTVLGIGGVITIKDRSETPQTSQITLVDYSGDLTINGTAGNDIVNISQLGMAATVNTGAGDDVIYGAYTFNVGEGNDTIVVNLASDTGATDGLELRRAIALANSGEYGTIAKIDFAQTFRDTNGTTVTLNASKGALPISGSYEIDGSSAWVNNDITNPGRSAEQITVTRSATSGAANRLFTVDSSSETAQNVTLTNLLVSGGYATQGGGIYNAENLTLNHVTVQGNRASQGAGVYNAAAGTLTVNNVLVQNNNLIAVAATTCQGAGIDNEGIMTIAGDLTVSSNGTSSGSLRGNGGGIYNGKTVNMAAGVTGAKIYVRGNLGASGGGIYQADNARMTLEGVIEVTDNTASTNGGGVNVGEGSLITITSGNIINIEGNTSGGMGGGIYIPNVAAGAGLHVDLNGGTSIIGNTAVSGGGIYAGLNSRVEVEGAEIKLNDNAATGTSMETTNGDGGGAVNFGTMILEATTTVISGNIASGSGAGVANIGTLELKGGTQFQGNTASGDDSNGGALYNTGTVSSVASAASSGDITFTGNMTTQSGGAVYNAVGATLNLSDNLTFTSNAALNDAGGALANYGTFTLRGGLTATENSARIGGAIAGSGTGSTTTVNGTVTLTNNSAKANGGALAIVNDATVTFNGSTSMTGNTAVNRGGAVYTTEQTMQLVGTDSGEALSITGNTSGLLGAGLYLSGASNSFMFGANATISGNKAVGASVNGANLFVDSGVTVTVEGAQITGTEADFGTGVGGVYLEANAVLNVKPGTAARPSIVQLANGSGTVNINGSENNDRLKVNTTGKTITLYEGWNEDESQIRSTITFDDPPQSISTNISMGAGSDIVDISDFTDFMPAIKDYFTVDTGSGNNLLLSSEKSLNYFKYKNGAGTDFVADALSESMVDGKLAAWLAYCDICFSDSDPNHGDAYWQEFFIQFYALNKTLTHTYNETEYSFTRSDVTNLGYAKPNTTDSVVRVSNKNLLVNTTNNDTSYIKGTLDGIITLDEAYYYAKQYTGSEDCCIRFDEALNTATGGSTITLNQYETTGDSAYVMTTGASHAVHLVGKENIKLDAAAITGTAEQLKNVFAETTAVNSSDNVNHSYNVRDVNLINVNENVNGYLVSGDNLVIFGGSITGNNNTNGVGILITGKGNLVSGVSISGLKTGLEISRDCSGNTISGNTIIGNTSETNTTGVKIIGVNNHILDDNIIQDWEVDLYTHWANEITANDPTKKFGKVVIDMTDAMTDPDTSNNYDMRMVTTSATSMSIIIVPREGQAIPDRYKNGDGTAKSYNSVWWSGAFDSLEVKSGSGSDYLDLSKIAVPVTIYGGAGDDYIQTGIANSVVHAGDGNDFVIGRGGDDILYGDAGNDVIMGGYGSDSIYGGDGSDLVIGGYFNGDLDAIYKKWIASPNRSTALNFFLNGDINSKRILYQEDDTVLDGGNENPTNVGFDVVFYPHAGTVDHFELVIPDGIKVNTVVVTTNGDTAGTGTPVDGTVDTIHISSGSTTTLPVIYYSTLRQAITYVNEAYNSSTNIYDVYYIYFDNANGAGTSTEYTVTLGANSAPLPSLNANVIIDGGVYVVGTGTDKYFQINNNRRITIDINASAGDPRRGFVIENDRNVYLKRLGITNAYTVSTTNPTTNDYQGAAIYNKERGNLTLSNVVVSNNTVYVTSDDIQQGGAAVYNKGLLNIEDSTFQKNNVTFADSVTTAYYSGGGAIYNFLGATIRFRGTNLVDDNTVAGTGRAIGGGGIHNRGAITGLENGALDPATLTVSNNTAANYGGGWYQASDLQELGSLVTICGNSVTADDSSGGGLYISSGNSMILNGVQIYNNKAVNGGGVYVSNAAPDRTGILYLTGNTMIGGNGTAEKSGNTAQNGGGIYNNAIVKSVQEYTITYESNSLGAGYYSFLGLAGAITADSTEEQIRNALQNGVRILWRGGQWVDDASNLTVAKVQTYVIEYQYIDGGETKTGSLTVQMTAGILTADSASDAVVHAIKTDRFYNFIEGEYHNNATNYHVTSISESAMRTSEMNLQINYNTATQNGGAIYNANELLLSGSVGEKLGYAISYTYLDENGKEQKSVVYEYLPYVEGTEHGPIEIYAGTNNIGYTVNKSNPESPLAKSYVDKTLQVAQIMTITPLYTSNIDYNQAYLDGGAIYNAAGANANITNTVIEGNKAEDVGATHIENHGGAVYNEGKLELGACAIGNSFAGYGGAIYNASTGTLSNYASDILVLVGNIAHYDGGAIYNANTTAGACKIEGSALSAEEYCYYRISFTYTIEGDLTEYSYSRRMLGFTGYEKLSPEERVARFRELFPSDWKISADISLTVEESLEDAYMSTHVILYTLGTGEMGLYFFDAPSGRIDFNSTSEQVMEVLAGALKPRSVVTSATMIAESSLYDVGIYYNFAGRNGGAIYNAGDFLLNKIMIYGGISTDTAAGLGGGIYNAQTGVMELDDSGIGGCIAYNGGGVYNLGTFTSLNSDTYLDIVGNQAINDGAGIYNANGGIFKVDGERTGTSTYIIEYKVKDNPEPQYLFFVAPDGSMTRLANFAEIYVFVKDLLPDNVYSLQVLEALPKYTNVISGNHAGNDGGGLFNESFGNGGSEQYGAKVSKVNYYYNFAYAGNTNGGKFGDGGGIYNKGSILADNVKVMYNEADNGGGIFNATGGTIDSAGQGSIVIIVNEAVENGGGVYNQSGATCKLEGTVEYASDVHVKYEIKYGYTVAGETDIKYDTVTLIYGEAIKAVIHEGQYIDATTDAFLLNLVQTMTKDMVPTGRTLVNVNVLSFTAYNEETYSLRFKIGYDVETLGRAVRTFEDFDMYFDSATYNYIQTIKDDSAQLSAFLKKYLIWKDIKEAYLVAELARPKTEARYEIEYQFTHNDSLQTGVMTVYEPYNIFDGLTNEQVLAWLISHHYVPAGQTIQSVTSWTENDVRIRDAVIKYSFDGQNFDYYLYRGPEGYISSDSTLEEIKTALGGMIKTESGKTENDIVSFAITDVFDNYSTVVSYNNAQSGNGGGLYNEGTITLVEMSVTNNEAESGFGGGVYNNSVANICGLNSVFNTAGNGGGAYNDAKGVFDHVARVNSSLCTSIISFNAAIGLYDGDVLRDGYGNGGGVYNAGKFNVEYSNDLLSMLCNSAVNNGGAIYNKGTLNLISGLDWSLEEVVVTFSYHYTSSTTYDPQILFYGTVSLKATVGKYQVGDVLDDQDLKTYLTSRLPKGVELYDGSSVGNTSKVLHVLPLSAIVIDSNSAVNGGGIYSDGTESSAQVNLYHVVLDNNIAQNKSGDLKDGGAIYVNHTAGATVDQATDDSFIMEMVCILGNGSGNVYNQNIAQSGSGIYVNSGKVSVAKNKTTTGTNSYLYIADISASVSGGGVYVANGGVLEVNENAAVVLTGCSAYQNNTTLTKSQGGGVYIAAGGTLYSNGEMYIGMSSGVSSEELELALPGYNVADEGGGIYNAGTITTTAASQTTVMNGFTTFYSKGNGGGIYNASTGCIGLHGNVTFALNNSRTGYGGGVYNSGTFLYTADTDANSLTFLQNRAYTGGGFVNQGTAKLTGTEKSNVLFQDNTTQFLYNEIPYVSDGNGGGFVSLGVNLWGVQTVSELTNVTFYRNRTSNKGGGLYIFDNPTDLVTLNNVTVDGGNLSALDNENNFNAKEGGGIYVFNGNVQVKGDLVVKDCTATFDGGGIYNKDSIVNHEKEYYEIDYSYTDASGAIQHGTITYGSKESPLTNGTLKTTCTVADVEALTAIPWPADATNKTITNLRRFAAGETGTIVVDNNLVRDTYEKYIVELTYTLDGVKRVDSYELYYSLSLNRANRLNVGDDAYEKNALPSDAFPVGATDMKGIVKKVTSGGNGGGIFNVGILDWLGEATGQSTYIYWYQYDSSHHDYVVFIANTEATDADLNSIARTKIANAGRVVYNNNLGLVAQNEAVQPIRVINNRAANNGGGMFNDGELYTIKYSIAIDGVTTEHTVDVAFEKGTLSLASTPEEIAFAVQPMVLPSNVTIICVDHITESESTINNGSISNNQAGGNGGGIYNISLFNSDGELFIKENTANQDGGAIYNNSNLRLEGSDSPYNAVYNVSYEYTVSDDSTVYAASVSIVGDRQSGYYNEYQVGDALQQKDIDRFLYDKNNIPKDATVIKTEITHIEIEQTVQIIKNEALRGGGLFMTDDATSTATDVMLDGTTIVWNKANEGATYTFSYYITGEDAQRTLTRVLNADALTMSSTEDEIRAALKPFEFESGVYNIKVTRIVSDILYTDTTAEGYNENDAKAYGAIGHYGNGGGVYIDNKGACKYTFNNVNIYGWGAGEGVSDDDTQDTSVAQNGGGLFIAHGSIQINEKFQVYNCTVSGNFSSPGNYVSDGNGGGVFVSGYGSFDVKGEANGFTYYVYTMRYHLNRDESTSENEDEVNSQVRVMYYTNTGDPGWETAQADLLKLLRDTYSSYTAGYTILDRYGEEVLVVSDPGTLPTLGKQVGYLSEQYNDFEVQIRNNEAVNGGGIYNRSADFKLYSVFVANNYANNEVIAIRDDGSDTGCDYGKGGQIYTTGAGGVLDSVVIIGRDPSDQLVMYRDNVGSGGDCNRDMVYYSYRRSNANQGGGLYLASGASVNYTGESMMLYCQATEGGAMYNESLSTIEFKPSSGHTFSLAGNVGTEEYDNNGTSNESGGAIFSHGTVSFIMPTTVEFYSKIYDNIAARGDGGAILITASGLLTMKLDSTKNDGISLENETNKTNWFQIYNNYSAVSGGAIWSKSATQSVINYALIYNNYAGGRGGGLWVGGSTGAKGMQLMDCDLYNNEAHTNFQATFKGENEPVAAGGGITVFDTGLEIRGVVNLFNNAAYTSTNMKNKANLVDQRVNTGNGGGMYIRTYSIVTVQSGAQLNVYNNMATNDGGGIYNDGQLKREMATATADGGVINVHDNIA